MSARPQLPQVTWPPPNPATGGVAPRAALFRASEASINQQTMRFVPRGTPIRVVLGEDRLGALVVNALPHGSWWVVDCLWCWDRPGCEGVQSITLNDAALPASVQVTHYDGTQTVPDPWLAAAFAAQGESYTDVLSGWCRSVVRVPVSLVNEGGVPTIHAVVRGVKAYDERSGLTVWTDNPSVLTAAYIENADWGMARSVDHSTVPAAANANDEDVGGEPRRRLGMTIARQVAVEDMLESLRTYAGCWVIGGADGAQLIPDRPIATFTDIGDGTAIKLRHVDETEKRSRSAAPTLLRVWYTDRREIPWRRSYAEVKHPLLDSGGVPYLDSDVRLPGIPSYSQAVREGTERINHLKLSDLTVRYGLFDEGVRFRPGDGVRLTCAPAALSAKPLRIFSADGGLGDWDFVAKEYDPAAYSDAVGTEPTYGDTVLADPTKPQPPENLALAEEVFEQGGDSYATRIRATWSPPSTFPWAARYRVNVLAGSLVVDSGTVEAVDTLAFRSVALTEGVTYQVDVKTISSSGTPSAEISDTLTAQGKALPPPAVTGLTGFESGGEVRLWWDAAIDVDIRRYEVRWVAPGGTWDNAEVIDQVDALRIVTRDVPEGTWDFHVRAVDSVPQYSPSSTPIEIEVTLDDGAFLVDSSQLDTFALVNAAEVIGDMAAEARRFVSTDGVPWHTKFPAAMNTYTQPLLSYFDSAASSITLPSGAAGFDFGQSLSGNWSGELTASAIKGAVLEELGLDNGAGFTDYTPMVAKVTARFARVQASAAAGSVFAVDVPRASVRVAAVGRKFKGSATSSASGPTTIFIVDQVGEIAAFNGPVTITPGGTTAASYTVDNYQVGANPSFDVRLFDAAGNQDARDFGYGGEAIG